MKLNLEEEIKRIELMTSDELRMELARVMTMNVVVLATVLATIAKTEDDLLDGIRLACDGLREMACDKFVKKQQSTNADPSA